MYHYIDESGGFSPETWDSIKNGSRNAVLSGHSQATAREVHEQAIKYAASGQMTYDEAENAILKFLASEDTSRVNLNAALDKYSQPMRPGPGLDKTNDDVYKIMKHRQVKKSSKGKHPSNFTPPKKKRK